MTIRRLLACLSVGAVLVAGLACGSDEGTSEESQPSAAAALGRLDPEQFATRMGDAGAQVINVHIPYEGELERTDAFIPFDRIVDDAAVPADKGSEVLLYCMSGRMSETAGNALAQAGYTNVSHLEGGMKAWEAAGKTLIHKPQAGGSTGDTY
ncbi:MAG: rhodanese-like domain-containing protein [Acidimicrobiia bacterium]